MLSRRQFAVGASAALGAGRVAGANDRIAVGVIGCGGRGLLKEVLQFAREFVHYQDLIALKEIDAVVESARPTTSTVRC